MLIDEFNKVTSEISTLNTKFNILMNIIFNEDEL